MNYQIEYVQKSLREIGLLFDIPIIKPDGDIYWALVLHIGVLFFISVYSFYAYFKQRRK